MFVAKKLKFITSILLFHFVAFSSVPWVPESQNLNETKLVRKPQNLNERKLVRGKERRKKGELSFLPHFFFLLFFGSGTQGISSAEAMNQIQMAPKRTYEQLVPTQRPSLFQTPSYNMILEAV